MMRLGLWLKLTAAVVFAALVPVAVTAWIARHVVIKRYEQEHRERADEVYSLVRQEVEHQITAVARKVASIASDSDPKIGRALVELSRGRLPPDLRRELDEEGPQLMRHLGLDVLFVTDGHGRLITCGHEPGRVGKPDPLPAQLADRLAGRAALVLIPVEVKSGPGTLEVRRQYALVAARRVRGPGAQVVVAGGVLLERALFGRLPRKPGVSYQLRSLDGRVLRRAPGSAAPVKDLPTRRIPLAGAAGRPAAHLVVVVSDEELRLSRQRLDLTIMALAGSAFLFVVLVVGALVVRRLSGRLGKVAVAAERVAGGDLEVTLPPGPRDEVGDLVRAFNKMTGDLREARERLVRAERIAAWQEIARRLAHEIKNPLTPIQISIETLRRAHQVRSKEFEEVLEESTATILEEVQRLRHIVGEFSKFARLPKPALAPCDLNEVIRQAVGLYEGDGVTVEMSLGELPEVQADREQMMQVLHNLLANATDAVAGRDEPRILVASHHQGPFVAFAVEDNGHGFDETVREQLFTPYFTTKEGRGTGLGLAIVHRIVTEHGGTISVMGSKGRGASFTVRLPAPA